VLDFQGFAFYAIFTQPLRNLYAAFTQRINSLIFNALPTSSKSLIFNGFTVLDGSRVGVGRGKGGAWWGFVIMQFLAIVKKP